MRLSSRACAALLVTSALSSPAIGQVYPSAPPPVRQSVDKNGVDLFLGTFNARGPVLSLGQSDQGVSYYQTNTGSGWGDNLMGELVINGSTYTVWLDGKSDSFTGSGGVYTSTEGNGSTLTSGTGWTYTRRDGTVVTFSASYNNRPTSITLPNGSQLSFHYSSIQYCTSAKQGGSGPICTSHGTMSHLSYLTSNFGYNIDLNYAFDSVDFDPNNPADNPDAFGWDTLSGVSGLNIAAGNGASTPSQSFADTTISGSNYHILTDAIGRQTKYRMSGNQVVGITLPGSTSEDETVTYTSGRVTSVVTLAGTTTYSSSDSGNVRTVTVTDPMSHVSTYTFDIPSNRMTSVTDPNNHTTTMVYDSNGRMTKLTEPEGNYTTWTYDGRGNITQVDQTAKSGSGLSDIVTNANYDSTCTYVAKCNMPNWTKDALGNETDYTYDTATGNLLTATLPAPTTGANRPQTRYGYTQLQAYYADSTGSIVASGLPIYRLTSISECQTGSSCSGTSDEVKATISYGPQTTGVGNNLLPVSVSAGDGTGGLTATTAYTYDDIGNLTYVDGPLSGTADTSRTLYDADREVIGMISPDPDGAGSLQNRAVRNTIDSRGLLTRVETGTTNGQTDSAWSSFATAQQVDITYDSRGRVTTKEVSAGGTPYALSQTDYNADDSVNCVATRMNTAVYGALPSSACTLSTQGSFGPDRITKNSYDAAGQLTSVQVAYGTGDQATEGALAYSNNGKVASLTDGENNKTSYVYDGFDRLSEAQYPSPTKGAGTSNSSDYERLSYDADGNVTSRRLRDGTSISYTYDNLSRATLKTLPNSEPAVTYTYDLLNRITGMSEPGYSMSFGYDALSRQTAENEGFGSITRQFDLAGRLTRTTWWDGFYVTYDRLVTGELTAVRENGAASGVGVLASYTYDNLGNRTGLTFGNGATQTYAYDPVSRLQTLTNNLSGTGNSLTIGGSSTPITYNPAGQILSAPRSNDAYAFPGYYDVNRGYTSNGLNQYSAAGTANFTFDARGNLTSDGTNSYTYSSENLLKSASGGVTLYYDPLHRLTEYDTSVSTRFVYDGSNMAAEVDNPAGAIQKRCVFDDNGTPIIEYSGSGTTNRQFVSTDERGSIISLTDSSGNLIGINKYDEYGIPASSNVGRFGYTGQAWLSEIGLQYSKARIYSPTLGRFMQTDPIGPLDSSNLYQYALDDPANQFDPTGLTAIYITAPRCPSGWSCVPAGDLSLQQILNLGLRPTLDPGQLIGDDCTHSGAGALCTVTITAKRKPPPKPTGSTPFYWNGSRWAPDPLYDPRCANEAVKALIVDALGLVPGESTAVSGTKFAGAMFSAFRDAAAGDGAGAALGYGGMMTELFGPAGANAGKAVPFVGAMISGTSLYRDVNRLAYGCSQANR